MERHFIICKFDIRCLSKAPRGAARLNLNVLKSPNIVSDRKVKRYLHGFRTGKLSDNEGKV